MIVFALLIKSSFLVWRIDWKEARMEARRPVRRILQ